MNKYEKIQFLKSLAAGKAKIEDLANAIDYSKFTTEELIWIRERMQMDKSFDEWPIDVRERVTNILADFPNRKSYNHG